MHNRATATTRRPESLQRYAAAAVLASLWVGLPGSVNGAQDALSEFAGRYAGVSVAETTLRATPTPSDVHLEVRPRDEGFVLRWQSLTELDSGIKHHYEVVFEKTRRPGIYVAGMRCDVFGHSRPLDPALGEPYVWAHLAEDRLTLYAMSIANDGSHDLSLYRYRRDGAGMSLEFRRMRDDRPAEWVNAQLRRVPPAGLPITPASEQNARQHTAAGCG